MNESRMKLHENRCRQCKKLFCCVNCRFAHENRKHSERELKCALCCSKKLQIKGDESHEFICHLVFNHLPLLCRLCGQFFQSDRDLAILKKCGWWKTEKSQRLLKFLGKTFPNTPSSETKPSLNLYSTKESVTESRHSGDFVTFNSPLVLTRNTSTPVQIGLSTLKGNFEFKALNAATCRLKTPRNFPSSLEENGYWPIFDSSEIRRCSSDTLYYSGSGLYSQTRSLLQGSSLAKSSINSSTNTTPYYTCDQIESDSCRSSNLGPTVEETTEVKVPNKKEVKESTKRVRFSDQFEHLSKMAENEDDFFEAQENLLATSHKHNDNVKEPEELENLTKGTSDFSANQENQLNVEKENKVSFEGNNNFQKENQVHPKENDVCPKENQACLDDTKLCPEEDKENSLPNIQPGNLDPAPSVDNPTTIEQSGLSRVVMMVLVENTSRLSRSEWAPLIDSGLKKLEENALSLYSSTSSRSSQVERNENGTGTRESRSGARRRSLTSVNSYVSVTSTSTSTECFSARSGSQWQSSNESSSSKSVESSKSDGILSVMARVVRNALRKLPVAIYFFISGASSVQKESRESRMQNSHSAIASASALPTSSYNSTSPLYSTSNQPPSKRRRDPTSPPEISGSRAESDERSPIAKRPRGWYKIRAREPIARMRKIQVTSPKGVSSETQRFQQGSLSVGRENTVLPLPSRAHQCTETE